MRFAPALLDEIRARMPVSTVVARKVRLKRQGREFVGLSPFKTEKTPSFFVNDQKGFYHCFASGEHGDVFTFLMKTEGLSFPEAVERLAGEAGISIPRPTREAEEHESQRARLLALLEASASFFTRQLAGSVGAEARRYLDRRGLSPDTRARFRLGYAPASRHALRDHLTAAGFTGAEMIASGMLIGGDDIPVAYDRFRHRVMFPISDLRGRIIAFGGRALDPEAPAKYLNSPESPLFHKGAVLYNAAGARALAHERGQVVAVEGYMDVIALCQAGIEHVVAPLGTALTDHQLQLLWRMAPEPVLCFDGDAAGRRAAYRAVDTALPLLGPGRSIAFAFLPEGMDPDDLVRQQGLAAVERVIERVRPLAEVLWEREWASGQWTTPERRALLEKTLSSHVARIGDPAVRHHYARAIRDRLTQAWGQPAGARTERTPGLRDPSSPRQDWRRPARHPGPKGRTPDQPARPRPSPSLKLSRLVAQPERPPYREALLLRALLNHPWLLEEHAEAVAGIAFSHASLGELRDALLSLKSNDISLDSCALRSQLEAVNLRPVVGLVDGAITHRSDRFAEPDAERADVEVGWRHTVALHARQGELKAALESAERAFLDEGSEESLARIREVQSLIASLDYTESPADM